MSVMKGDVTLKGQPTRVCKNKRLRRKNGARVVRRVCSKRPKSILPDVETREARGYTIFKGERLFFYLPPGNWRISARGEGLSLSAVGEGRAGVQAAPQGEAPEFLATESTGLISVGGELYDEWPLRWTLFEFGPDLGTDEEEPPAREVDQKTRTTISGSRIGLDRPMAEPPPSDSEQPAKEDKNGTTVAESARTLYSFGAEVPTVHG